MLKKLENCGDDYIHLIFKSDRREDTIGVFKRSKIEERFHNNYNMNIFYSVYQLVSCK